MPHPGPRLPPRLRSAGLAGVAGFLAGCADLIDLPDPAPPPILIEAVLIAGAPLADFRISRATPLESTADPPIAVAAVALRLARAGRTSMPLWPDPDSAGRFRASLPIEAGARYRLAGTVDGVAVEAETTVPNPLEIIAPAGDTIALESGRIQQLSFRWRAGGASILTSPSALFLLEPAGSGAAPRTRDTVGTLLLAPLPAPGDQPIEFWALNQDADLVALATWVTGAKQPNPVDADCAALFNAMNLTPRNQ